MVWAWHFLSEYGNFNGSRTVESYVNTFIGYRHYLKYQVI